MDARWLVSRCAKRRVILTDDKTRHPRNANGAQWPRTMKFAVCGNRRRFPNAASISLVCCAGALMLRWFRQPRGANC